MGRIFAVAVQYLVTLPVLTLGLSFSGCSDSASVNPVVELASLTVTPGTLQPSFSAATTQYQVDLANNVPSVTVAAQPAVAGDRVTINGEATTSRQIDLGAAGTTTPVNIVVSESGTNSRTYTVLITKAGLTGNNSLRSLSISPGPLEPGFNANTLSYEVSVASNVTGIRMTPALEDPAATMTVNGQAVTSGQAQTIPLRDPGLSTILTIVVTAQNGTPKTYTVVVSRAALGGNNDLHSLTVSPGSLTPAFNRTRPNYTVNVGGRVESVTVAATKADSNATMTINGQPANSGQARSISLGPNGTPTEIHILVTAQNGSQKTYFITVNRAALSSDNNLEALNVTPGTLEPEFSAGTQNYSVDVPFNVAEVAISAAKSDPTAVISGDLPNQGQATIPLGGPGTSKAVRITVTAPNGDSKTYAVAVNRLAPSTDSNLSNLTVSAGSLIPNFTPGTQNYRVDVSSANDTVTIRATKSDPNAVMSASGSVIAAAGIPVGQVTSPLGLGTSTPVAITVTAQDGISRKTYTINVNRPAR